MSVLIGGVAQLFMYCFPFYSHRWEGKTGALLNTLAGSQVDIQPGQME